MNDFSKTFLNSIRQTLFKPVDIASLVYFRIIFGSIMLWEMWRYFENDWIRRYWIDPEFHFTYLGFSWVQPLPGTGMYILCLVISLLSIFIIFGFWYKLSISLFFFGFTYLFLLEQARYLNHFYFISLVSFLMIFIPAHRAFSIDALRNPRLRRDPANGGDPSLHSSTTPSWTVWLLRFQIGIVYFYGGLAKLNADWLNGEPMRMWLNNRLHYPVIGQFFDQEWMIYLFSYSGLFFDLLIVPFLLWKKTRAAAFIIVVLFHLLNAWIFRIGIFPWFTIAATALFFSPDFPRRLLERFWIFSKGKLKQPIIQQSNNFGNHFIRSKHQTVLLLLIIIYTAIQLLFPLRHFLYPGDVSWTEEGHRFSWHMKLRDKKADAAFFVSLPESNTFWRINPLHYLTKWQARKMSIRPDMILQFSHHIAEKMHEDGHKKVKVYVRVMASLNGRELKLLINPSYDLSEQPQSLLPAPWIMPLEDP